MAKREGSEPNAAIDWLERDRNLGEGLDHLGVQAVSVNLYTRLLPGLTNVTERARYYGVYPWALHRFAQDKHRRGDRAAWLTWIRSIDFAYAAAAMASDRSTTGVVGADRARQLLRGKDDDDVIDIASPAALDKSGKVPSKGAYFQATEGGYGQYYKGALEVLGLLGRDEAARHPDRILTTYAGLPIARAIDAQESFQRLLGVATEGRATLSDLKAIGAATSPGAIDPDGFERDVLRRLVLATDDDLCRGQSASSRGWRRASLLLALLYAREAETVAGDFPYELRWACASQSLPDGSKWVPPGELGPTMLAWAAYHRNDLLGYSLEALHLLALRHMDDGDFTPAEIAAYITELAIAPIPQTEQTAAFPAITGTVTAWLKQCAPDAEAQAEPWGQRGTWRWAAMLQNAVRDRDDEAIAAWAARLLGRLATERDFFETYPFEHFPDGAEIAASREVHIGSWLLRTAERTDELARSFLRQLVLEWVLYRHLRVATRKLATQGISTFKFRPELGRLVRTVDSMPMPTLTNPRLREGHRFLVDLGYLDEVKGGTRLTEDGAEALGDPR